MRQPQAANSSFDIEFCVSQNHDQRNEKSQSGRDLNEAGVEATLVVGNVLAHVNCGAAIFTAQRQPLQHADQQQHDRREPPRRRE